MTNVNPMFNLNAIKQLALNNGWYLKNEIDTCRPGQIVSIPTKLPAQCVPDRANICFSSHEEMYCVMVDQTVYYSGNNESLAELFDRQFVGFDNWQQLQDYFRKLPEYCLV